jgi:RNA-directed DNA polymerase
MDRAKPFCIAKRDVWEAYRQVKANRGAAGVDEQSLEDFDRNLSKNLYRIWNRMCSGSYFPPPVRRVDIPKGGSGGTRPLGIPTVSDRIAQMVVKRYLELILESVFDKDSYGYRPGKSAHTHSSWPDVDVGNTTGCSIWTSKASSMKSTGIF